MKLLGSKEISLAAAVINLVWAFNSFVIGSYGLGILGLSFCALCTVNYIRKQIVALIFTFLLVASLEMAFAHNNPDVKEETEESAEDLDMCVGCDKEEEKKKEEKKLRS